MSDFDSLGKQKFLRELLLKKYFFTNKMNTYQKYKFLGKNNKATPLRSILLYNIY